MKVWLLMQVSGPEDPWEIGGAFASREDAIAAGKAGDVVGPLEVGKPAPRVPDAWPGSEWIGDEEAAAC